MYSLAYCLVFWSKAPSACPRAGTLSIPTRLVGFKSKGQCQTASYSIIALIQHYTASWVGQGSVVRVSASYGKCCNGGSKVGLIDPPGGYSWIQPEYYYDGTVALLLLPAGFLIFVRFYLSELMYRPNSVRCVPFFNIQPLQAYMSNAANAISNQQSRETVVGTSASITVSSVTTLNSTF